MDAVEAWHREMRDRARQQWWERYRRADRFERERMVQADACASGARIFAKADAATLSPTPEGESRE